MVDRFRIGNTTIEGIVEATAPMPMKDFIPNFTLERMRPHMKTLAPRFLDEAGENGFAAFRSWIVRTGRHVVLIDSCIGNDKDRPGFPPFHQMKTDYLQQLASVGLKPEQVDYVFCTHFHVDHVGWNTRLADGKWVPTFPNAKYIFARKELNHWQTLPKEEVGLNENVFEDSIEPILDAKLAHIIDDDFQLDDRLTVVPTPGHTPGHYSILLQDGSERGCFTGDIMHHPTQVFEPNWNSGFCLDAPTAIGSRKRILERAVSENMLLLPVHFASPGAGRVSDHNGAFILDI
jgi:glyoxylase-like metal-dependent hydrolase (beta-lactamase superfamily II)